MLHDALAVRRAVLGQHRGELVGTERLERGVVDLDLGDRGGHRSEQRRLDVGDPGRRRDRRRDAARDGLDLGARRLEVERATRFGHGNSVAGSGCR